MPSLTTPPVLTSQFIVTANIFPGSYFTQFSGLKDKNEVTTYADGLDFRKFQLVGLATLEAMTLTIPYAPGIHEDLILRKKNNPCERFVLSVTPVNCNREVIESNENLTLYLTGCQLSGVEAYAVDRTATTLSTIQLDFVADDYYLG